MAERSPAAPVVVAAGVAVVVAPNAVAAVHALVADAVRRRHQRREATPADLAVLEVLRAATSANAGVTACGHVIATSVAPPAAPPAEWLTVNGCAAALGRSPRSVRRLASRGGLPGARRDGRDWIVPAAAVALLASPPPDPQES